MENQVEHQLENQMEAHVSTRLIQLIDHLTRGNEKKFAESIGVKPAVINNYTTGKQQSKPGFEVLSKILAIYPEVDIHWLITGDGEMFKGGSRKIIGKPNFQVVVATQDTSGNVVVPVINRKAAANYLTGHQTQEYFEQLDSLNLPANFKKGSNPCYALQVAGDSMQPTLSDGDLVICSLVESSDWEYMNDGDVYVVVSDKGLQVKRIQNRLMTNREIKFISDNKAHRPFTLEANEILEMWKVNWKLSMNLEAPNDEDLENRVKSLESKLEKLERKHLAI